MLVVTNDMQNYVTYFPIVLVLTNFKVSLWAQLIQPIVHKLNNVNYNIIYSQIKNRSIHI